MTVSDVQGRALKLLMQLACDIGAEEAMADEFGQLKDIADESGSIFGPAMRTVANSHRIRAMDLRCHVAVLMDEHPETFKDAF